MDPFLTDNTPPRTPRLELTALVCGVVLTVGLTAAGIVAGTRARVCVLIWQACLVQTVIHTPDNPIHEASPIDLFAFALGVFLGVPIYAAVSYGILKRWYQRPSAPQNSADD